MMKNKPEKYTWYEFLIKPFLRFLGGFVDTIGVNYLGYWWCDGCKKYHSPRVIKYRIKGGFFSNKDVCSLHKEDNHGR